MTYPYILPPLPYAPAALEPNLGRSSVRLHHDAFFAAYVDRLNGALVPWTQYQDWPLERLLLHWCQLRCENPVGIRMASERGWLRTFISKDSKNIDACLRLIDYLMSEEGNRFAQYGVEGEHYKWEGEKLVRLIDDEKTNELDLNKFFIGNTVLFDHSSDELFDAFEFSHTICTPNPADGIFIDELNDIYPKLKEITNTRFIEMIVGETPIDGGFEDFVKEWNSL